MISFVKGRVIEASGNNIIVECGGIGYELTATASAVSACESGEEAQIFTYFAANENQIFLYGFKSRDEREMFKLLITVSGIGPKLAVTILSGVSLGELAGAILSGDGARLNMIKGVGKKTSERIILELREKIESARQFAPSMGGKKDDEIDAAVITLSALGIKPSEAARLAKEAFASGMPAEEIVLKVLKNK